MATAKTPKAPRPTPGPGDTNTPQQVAQVNKATATAERSAPAAAPASSPQGAPGAEQQALPPIEIGGEENHAPDSGGGPDAALYGPTRRPNEPITTGNHTPIQRPTVSPGTMAALRVAAQDPQSPPEVTNLLNLLSYHLNKE